MIAYTFWSEAGGVGKTTLAVNLPVAHARHGQDVLVIDLDPQDGSLTHHFGVGDERDDDEVDNLVRHMVKRPKGEFDDLVRTVEHGVDVVPGHNMLDELDRTLHRTQEIENNMGDRFRMETQLRRVLQEANVHERYDVLVIDPPATGGQHVYNAIAATQNVAIPLELTAKGEQSIKGLEDTVKNLEAELRDQGLNIDVGVVAVIPNKVRNTSTQSEYRDSLDELSYPVAPAMIPIRGAMLEDAWKKQMSAFTCFEQHRSADRERQTLADLDRIARFIANQFGVELEPADPVEVVA